MSRKSAQPQEARTQPNPVRYFAVGIDILWCESLAASDQATVLAHARVRDYRVLLNGGAGPSSPAIAPCQRATSWGTVYEIKNPGLCKWLVSRSLEEITVFGWDTQPILCLTEVVEHVPGHGEPVPAQELQQLIRLAEGVEDLPDGFVTFLKQAANPMFHRPDADLIVTGHIGTAEVPRIPTARLHPHEISKRQLGSVGTVEFLGHICPVEINSDTNAREGICQLNQAARTALGIYGRYSYGQHVALRPTRGQLSPLRPVSPRTLTLAQRRPEKLDSESNLVVLHENAFTRLGIEPGDYVRLTTSAPTDQSATGYALMHYSARAFPGIERSSRRANDRIDYPQATEIYIDAYGRDKLGIERDREGDVIVVSADIGRLFISRVVFYTATLMLSLVASRPLNDVTGPVWSLVIAVALTLAVTIFDLRSRVQF